MSKDSTCISDIPPLLEHLKAYYRTTTATRATRSPSVPQLPVASAPLSAHDRSDLISPRPDGASDDLETCLQINNYFDHHALQQSTPLYLYADAAPRGYLVERCHNRTAGTAQMKTSFSQQHPLTARSLCAASGASVRHVMAVGRGPGAHSPFLHNVFVSLVSLVHLLMMILK